MNALIDELREALFSVWQRRWIVLGVAWAVCVLGWLAVALMPNSYESKARIYVQLDDVLSTKLGTSDSAKRDVTRVRQTLTSAVNLEKVIKSTKLGQEVKSSLDMEGAIASLTKQVEVKSEEDNLFEIKAKVGSGSLSDAENAKLAQEVVQKLIDLFREQNIAGSRGEVASTVVFYDQQLEERKRELEEAEAKRMAFEAANPDLIGGAAGLTSRIQGLRQEMRSVDSDLAGARSALAAIDGQMMSTPRTIQSAMSGSSAGAAFAQARSELAGLQARGLTPNHPDYVAAKKRVDLLARQAVNDRPTSSSSNNPAYDALLSIKAERQANVQTLTARKVSLQGEITQLMSSQASEPSVSAEAERISRDYKVLKDKYDELLKDREEMVLRGNVENSRGAFKFEVIDPPTSPRSPAAPNRLLFIFAVLILGIGAGGGAAFLFAKLSSSFNTTSKLEQVMDLPVVGAISYVATDVMKEKNRKDTRKFALGGMALCGLCGVLVVIELISRAMVA